MMRNLQSVHDGIMRNAWHRSRRRPWFAPSHRRRLMEEFHMFGSKIRIALVAFAALAAASSTALADSGRIYIEVVKGGWFIGASGGRGTLTFNGRRYPLSIGGASVGLVFGAAKQDLSGRVYNIRRPSDVAGVYGALGAGVAAGPGVGAIRLQNEKGAILELQGRQVGLMANADLSGLAISLR
jgi:hypothetical protein